MRFKLLAGRHIHGGVTYIAGDNDIVDSDIELDKKLGVDKFMRLDSVSSKKRKSATSTPPTREWVPPRKEELETDEPNVHEENLKRLHDADTDDDGDVDYVGEDDETDDDEEGDDTPDKPLENMTIRELMAFAHANDINLKGTTKKEDMLKVIRSSV